MCSRKERSAGAASGKQASAQGKSGLQVLQVVNKRLLQVVNKRLLKERAVCRCCKWKPSVCSRKERSACAASGKQASAQRKSGLHVLQVVNKRLLKERAVCRCCKW